MSAIPSTSASPAPPGGRSVHPGLVILWLASGTFAVGAGEFAAMSLLPYFASDLRVTEQAAGHAISAYALGVVVGAPLISVLAARLPRKQVLLGLMALFVAGNVWTALAPTMPLLIAGRFVAGLPHGAYFGVAMLFAAALGRPEQRAGAVSKVMLGLAIANVVGVPALTAVGQLLGWRYGFALVAALGALTIVMVTLTAPAEPGDAHARPTSELRALINPQVLVTLAAGAIGFGGMFAVYSYFSAAYLDSGAGPQWGVSVTLVIYGLGSTLGNILAGRYAHGRLLAAAAVFQLILGVAAFFYALTIGNALLTAVAMFGVGMGGGLVVPLQTRLMEVAGDAQTLAAAMNHVAFNLANAIGPFLAGLTIAAGWGWPSTGWVGVALAVAGLLILALARVIDRRAAAQPATTPA